MSQSGRPYAIVEGGRSRTLAAGPIFGDYVPMLSVVARILPWRGEDG